MILMYVIQNKQVEVEVEVGQGQTHKKTMTYDVTPLRHMTSQNSQILKNICFFKSSRSKVKLKVNVKSRSKVKVI